MPAGRWATCFSRNISIIWSAWWPRPASGAASSRPGSVPLNSCAATIRLSRTESWPNTCSVWNVRPTPRRDSSSGDMPVMSSSQNATLAGRRLDLAEDRVEQRRLAGAVRADDADDLAGLQRERHAVDGLDRAVVLADVLDFEERLAAARHVAAGHSARPPCDGTCRGSTASRRAARSSARRRRGRTPRGTRSA